MARRKGTMANACRGLVVLSLARWACRSGMSFVSGPGVQRGGAGDPGMVPGRARGQMGPLLAEEGPPGTLAPRAPQLALAGAVPWLAATALADPAAAQTQLAAGAAEGPIDPGNAIIQAFLLTFVSEIGDKTFFIAAILAAGGGAAPGQGDQKVLTFIGAITSLVVMTLLAVGLGQIFHAVPDIAGGAPIDDYASILVFGFFGLKLLLDASQMADDSSLLDEKEEAEEAVRDALPAWISGGAASLVVPPLVLRAFVLVFAAEIGDRSFISAAALSAQGGPQAALAVFVGGISAHTIATLAAVLLGDLISNYITEKQLTFIGGTLFLAFAGLSSAKLVGFAPLA